jgi:hypothetical protein
MNAAEDQETRGTIGGQLALPEDMRIDSEGKTIRFPVCFE